jgi:hypothetical protein
MEGTSTMVVMSVYDGKERILFPDLAYYSSSIQTAATSSAIL